MTKKSLVLFTLAIAISTVGFSQNLHLGIKAGANIFKLDGKTFNDEFKFGYNLGGFAEIGLGKKVSIQPEVLWNQTNYRTGTGSNLDTIYKANFKGDLNYLSIPILLNLKPGKGVTFQVGPQFGILLNKDETLLKNGQQAFKSGDFSMLGGVQFNLGALKIGGRYVVGLTDINDIDNKEKWKNQGFQVYLGYAIF